MDTIAGDGDCGLTLKGGATAVLRAIEEGRVSGRDIVSSLIAISQVAEEQMGGTSGALFSWVPFPNVQPESLNTLQEYSSLLLPKGSTPPLQRQ